MSVLARYTTILRKVHVQLANFGNDLDGIVDDIYNKIGSQPPQKVNSITAQAPAQPTPATVGIIGIAGVGFHVQITNPENVQPASMQLARAKIINGPNAPLTPIFHNVQSANDTNFNSASNVTDYGVSAQTLWPVLASGQTRYWRFRSSFDGQNWNPWQVYSGAAGPIAVSV